MYHWFSITSVILRLRSFVIISSITRWKQLDKVNVNVKVNVLAGFFFEIKNFFIGKCLSRWFHKLFFLQF